MTTSSGDAAHPATGHDQPELVGTSTPGSSPTSSPSTSRSPTPSPPTSPTKTWPARLAVALLLAVMLLPFVPLVLASASQAYFHPQVLPEQWSLRAWTIVLAPDGPTWPALRDSVTVAVLVTIVSLVVALPAGRVLATRRFRGKRAVELLLLAPILVPTIAVAIGIHVVFLRLGLAGSVAAVVVVHLIPVLPYVVLLTAAVFANADLELEAQARSLGATWWQAQLHVTRPLIAPGLIVASLFGFLVSWGQYALTLVIGGGRVVTLPILLFANASGGDAAVTAATALIHGAPAVVLLIVAARAFNGQGFVGLGDRQ